MPKSSEQAQPKPIYIPRNIYVPVIRPVFVPRERIIVRPQIIHVARPVLVDRPVPIQQRPIVIERDRPVPVRVETVEKTEPVTTNCTDVTKNVETSQEVTYHEFTQTYPTQNAQSTEYSSTSYQYGEQLEYEENRRKQEVMNIIEEADRRKQNLQSKSQEDLISQYNKYQSGSAENNSKTLDSMLANSQGYTLEVLDQRVSDKFEKTDTETIKARYGVESFQYLPSEMGQGSSSVNGSSSVTRGANYGNSNEIINSTSEFYSSSANANLGRSGSFKSLASVNETKTNSSSNIFSSYVSNSMNNNNNNNNNCEITTPYGTVTSVTQIPSPAGARASQSYASYQQSSSVMNIDN